MNRRSEVLIRRQARSVQQGPRHTQLRCADASQSLFSSLMTSVVWLERRRRSPPLGLVLRLFLRRAMFGPEVSPAAKSGLPPRVLTFLLALLAAGTRAKYLEQARRFGVWSQSHVPTWASMTIERQDAWFILDTRDEGLGVQACRDTITALELF